MEIQYCGKDDLIDVIQNEARIKVDSFLDSAIEEAENTHGTVLREDGRTSFLESHIFPVTVDVIRHYRAQGREPSSQLIAASLLHDIMEDDSRILDPYSSKEYGFDAYFRHRFGEYVYSVASTLKVKPLENYSEFDEKAQGSERFRDYCAKLLKSNYDTQLIKLADRINNMNFIGTIPGHEKITRYIREDDEFYLAFAQNTPGFGDLYQRMLQSHYSLMKSQLSAKLV